MRLKRGRRLVRARFGYTMLIKQGLRGPHEDHLMDHLHWREARAMFDGVEIGQVVVLLTYDFPIVGRVVSVDDTRITMKDSVRILWDGRHGAFASGKHPSTAEIEKTFPLLHVSLDDVRQWAPYPGGKIPAYDKFD